MIRELTTSWPDRNGEKICMSPIGRIPSSRVYASGFVSPTSTPEILGLQRSAREILFASNSLILAAYAVCHRALMIHVSPRSCTQNSGSTLDTSMSGWQVESVLIIRQVRAFFLSASLIPSPNSFSLSPFVSTRISPQNNN
jgi:hypothetical protein